MDQGCFKEKKNNYKKQVLNVAVGVFIEDISVWQPSLTLFDLVGTKVRSS